MRIRIQLFTLRRIRIQVPKIMRIHAEPDPATLVDNNRRWSLDTTTSMLLKISYSKERLKQSVLNDSLRTRLSRRRTIWLLSHPPIPSPVSNLSLFLSLPLCRRSRLLTEAGGGGRGWGRKEPNKKA
jgi:hypothetical protein